MPLTVTVIWAAVFPGAHVPEYTAPAALVIDSASGGSPFENVATTCAFGTATPQSSVTRTEIGCGQPAGEANAFTSEVLVSASLAGEQPAAERSFPEDEEGRTAPCGRTTKVTFAVRIVWLENDTEMSPV